MERQEADPQESMGMGAVMHLPTNQQGGVQRRRRKVAAVMIWNTAAFRSRHLTCAALREEEKEEVLCRWMD